MFAAVFLTLYVAEVPVLIDKDPRDVIPVLTAIVIVPDAVFITLKLNAKSVGQPTRAVSKEVPSGIVTV